jgi:hypothetical protein
VVKALILVSCTLGLTACPPDLVATGTAIKVLDLVDEDDTLYSGAVAKGSTTILVTLPDDYKLSARSTLQDEFKDTDGKLDEAKFNEECYKSGTLIKCKMTPKLTLSKGATLSDASQIKNNNETQVFAANTYLTLSVVNSSKTTNYKVYVGTQAQLDAIEQVGDPSTTQIASFDLYDTNKGKLSLNTLITHKNDQNDDKNFITIFLPADTPRIATGSSQIRLESPNTMLVTPVSGTLRGIWHEETSSYDDFEPNEPVDGVDSVLDATYTVYPIGQTPNSLFARTYGVVLKRTSAAQETPTKPETPAEPETPTEPEISLALDLTLTDSFQDTVPVGEKIGTFAASGSATSRGTPVYTLEAGDFGMTDGVLNDRDNDKFSIDGADLLVGAAELSSWPYYIVATVTIVDANGTPLTDITPVTRAFKIGPSEASNPGSNWGD